MRILWIENYDHSCFCNHDSTHFAILRVSANTLYDCYSRIVDSFIFIHLMKSARLLSKGLLCLYDNYLYRCAHSWAIELNTRREIPYLRAPMYYSLYLCHLLPIARDVPFNDQFRSVRHSTKTWSQSKSRRQLIKSHINWLPNREKKKKKTEKKQKKEY